ncbi:MAG: DNA-binding transcriptional regulator, partial [Mesorhizobium sp.]
MSKTRTYKSDAFEAIHSSARALYKVGAIDKTTMRSFDASCLTAPAAIGPDEIKALREKNHVSQPVFARYLNTSESTVQKWETGAKRPSGMALKLLSVVKKHGLAAPAARATSSNPCSAGLCASGTALRSQTGTGRVGAAAAA